MPNAKDLCTLEDVTAIVPGYTSGDSDPVGAFDPQPGSLYLRRVDDTHGEVYAKTGAGADGWTKVA